MPMKKPSCAEYILAAIRATRPERKGLKPGTSSGRSLRSIFSITSEFYSEEEFRQGLKALLDSGRVLLVAEGRNVADGTHPSWTPPRLVKVSTIPSRAPLGEGWWYLDAEGESIGSGATINHTRLNRLCLYLVEDGLPARIAGFITDGLTKAEQIMASLQE